MKKFKRNAYINQIKNTDGIVLSIVRIFLTIQDMYYQSSNAKLLNMILKKDDNTSVLNICYECGLSKSNYYRKLIYILDLIKTISEVNPFIEL